MFEYSDTAGGVGDESGHLLGAALTLRDLRGGILSLESAKTGSFEGENALREGEALDPLFEVDRNAETAIFGSN